MNIVISGGGTRSAISIFTAAHKGHNVMEFSDPGNKFIFYPQNHVAKIVCQIMNQTESELFH